MFKTHIDMNTKLKTNIKDNFPGFAKKLFSVRIIAIQQKRFSKGLFVLKMIKK